MYMADKIPATGKQALILFVFIAQCLFLLGSQKEQARLREDEYINWDEIKNSLAVYNACPSDENARRLLSTIPEKPAAKVRGNQKSVNFAIIESVPFAQAIIAGDEVLAEAAFRLFGYIGGGVVDEELRIMLGRFLTRKPGIFLRLLQKYIHLFPSKSDYPVDMTEILEIVPDITSVEDSNRRKKEEIRLYTKRIEALEKVEDPELTELRDACIRVIKKIIEIYLEEPGNHPPPSAQWLMLNAAL